MRARAAPAKERMTTKIADDDEAAAVTATVTATAAAVTATTTTSTGNVDQQRCQNRLTVAATAGSSRMRSVASAPK